MSKFSDMLSDFTCGGAIGNLGSICLGVNVLRTIPYVGFLISIFDGFDEVISRLLSPINFAANILPLKALRIFPLSLKRNPKSFQHIFSPYCIL